MSLNKILLLGNLGSDPDVRFLPSGKQTTQFSVATNRKYKVEGQLKEETEWFHVVTYGRLAEICSEFLKKGRQVFVEGRLKTRNWTDTAGQKHYKTEVIAEGIRLIGKSNNGSSPASTMPVEDNDSDPF